MIERLAVFSAVGRWEAPAWAIGAAGVVCLVVAVAYLILVRQRGRRARPGKTTWRPSRS